MTLEDRLERLANRTPPGDPSDVLAAARSRAESRPDTRSPRLLAAAAAVVAVLALAAGGLALTSDDSDLVTAAGPDETRSADELDGLWRVISTVDDGERRPAAGTASLRFDGDRVQGNDGCGNRMDTTLEDGVVLVPRLRTQIGCPDDAATEEADLFWAGLGQPIDLRDGELWMVADDGDGLVFSRADERQEVPAEAKASVTVVVDGFGPLEATVSPLTTSEQGWLEHTVTFENTGSETVHLQDFRTGTMLGDREVAVATDGCGYGFSGDQPAAMGCRLDYRPLTMEQGGTHTFTVTLWRELAGMNRVGDGSYEWSLSVDRRDTPFDHPDQTDTTGTVTLTYENLTPADGGSEPTTEELDDRGGLEGPVLYGPASHGVMEQAAIAGVLGREGDCLRLYPLPNVRDPLADCSCDPTERLGRTTLPASASSTGRSCRSVPRSPPAAECTTSTA